MRFFAYIAAVAVLFAIANRSAAQTIDTRAPAQMSARVAGLRMLTWPGKGAIGSPAKPTPPVAPRAAAPAPPMQQPAALPTSIYAPPPAKGAVARPAATRTLAMASPQAGAAGTTARFYSLHRAYGQTPDSIPLTPQFFASDSPDLARPPPPSSRPVVTSTGRVVQAAPSDPDATPVN